MRDDILMQFSILFGSIGVTISIFFSVLLMIRKEAARSNLFLAIYLLAFGLRIGKSLFHNYFEIPPTLRIYTLSILFCIGPSIWLFTKYLVYPKGKKVFREGLHYLLFIVMLPICWFIPNNGSLAFILFYNATILHMLGYTLYTFYWLQKAKRGENIKLNSQVTRWLQAFLVVNMITIIGYFLISQQIIPFYLGLAFLYSIVVVVFSAWGLKIPQLFSAPSEKYQASHLSIDQSAQLFIKLKHLMEVEKVYLDSSLSLAKLSQQVNASPKEVSQAINQVEQLNYAQFISRFRVEEAKRLLKSPSHRPFKISAIAYDSGFNSISSFNLLFKKHTKLTAKEFRDGENPSSMPKT